MKFTGRIIPISLIIVIVAGCHGKRNEGGQHDETLSMDSQLKVIENTVNEIDTDTVIFNTVDGLIDGDISVRDKDDNLVINGSYNQGARDGVFSKYSPAGDLVEYAFYRDNLIQYYKRYDSLYNVVSFTLSGTFTGSIVDKSLLNDDELSLRFKIAHEGLKNPYYAFILTIESTDTLSILETESPEYSFSQDLSESKRDSLIGKTIYLSVYEFDLINLKPEGGITFPFPINK